MPSDISPNDTPAEIIRKSKENSARMFTTIMAKLDKPFMVVYILTYGYLGCRLWMMDGFWNTFFSIILFAASLSFFIKLFTKPFLNVMLKWINLRKQKKMNL